MTAPQLIQRSLTFTFARSVSVSSGLPDVLQISIIPLQDATNVNAGATYAGGLKTQEIELSAPSNVVVFELLPSNAPGNDFTVNYRVMWRSGVMGRTFTYDFAMPDVDLTWEALVAGVGNIIDGQTYLQQSDLGVPGRVARLNSQGKVVDSTGTPVATQADTTTVTNLITTETNERQAADAALNVSLQNQLAAQINAVTSSTQATIATQVGNVSGDITAERGQRISADTDLQAQIIAANTALATEITTRASQHTDNITDLAGKADLDDTGHVLVDQIPEEILTNAYPVADQASMLGLSPSTVHKGSLAVRPDGVWLLTTDDPSQLGNWVSLTTVSSVNGLRENITLAAADVGAIPAGGAVTIGQVTGLSTALGQKALQTDLAALGASVAALQTDGTVVHTVSGVVPTVLMSSDMVYLNSVGQLVKKDGTIIPLGSGGTGAVFSVNSKTGLVVLTAADVGAIATGGSVTQGQVTGLSTALTNKADASTVSALATTVANKADLSSGLILLSQVPVLPQNKVTGLDATVTGNQLTTSTNAINRIASLESQIVSGGGGGGGGVSTQVPFYTSSNTTTPVIVSDFSTQVNLHSPWGIDSDATITGTIGTWYYLYTGVRSTDVAYPYISSNGHLNLRKWDETGPADPVYALSSTVATLTTTVGTKADQTALNTTNATVATKANQTDLTALSTTVDSKANTADFNSLSTTVSTKASAADLGTTNTTVATKASQTDLTALTGVVATKANSTDLATTNTNVANNTTALASKADLVTGLVPLGQLPSYPQSKVTGLSTSLSGKADLSGGTVPLAQLPTNISTNNIVKPDGTGLGVALAAKADLVAGTVPLSQLPSTVIPNVVKVNNRSLLLALTTAQVQYGDIALILPGDPDSGTYILTGPNSTSPDPSQFANWTPLSAGSAPVVSVNGLVGVVVLTPTSIGALSASAHVNAWDVASTSPLETKLATFATTDTLTQGLGTKTTVPDVQGLLYSSGSVKRVDFVSTTPITGSLSGLFSVDGALIPSGALVLLTAQGSAIANGIYLASSGSWSRPTDYATGKMITKDTVVLVSKQVGTTAGANNLTVWQPAITLAGGGPSPTGSIDTDNVAWSKVGNIAPPYAPQGSSGIQITNTQTVTVTGSPSGGTFTLSFGGQTTGAIAFSALASTVQTAFQALSSVGSGNAFVSGSAGGPYTIIFTGSLGAADITANGGSLTGGTSPGVSIFNAGKAAYAAVAPATTTPIGGNSTLNPGGTTIPGGIVVTSAGLTADPASIPRKFTATVPATSPAAITHNLNNRTPNVTIWDMTTTPSTPFIVTAGVTSPTVNSISIEFGAGLTPTSGQYTVEIIG